MDFIALPTLQSVPPRVSPSLKIDLLKAQARVDNWQNADVLNFTDSLIAPFDGMVTELNVSEGAQVTEGSLLVRIEKGD